jgi:hypothetical protein
MRTVMAPVITSREASFRTEVAGLASVTKNYGVFHKTDYFVYIDGGRRPRKMALNRDGFADGVGSGPDMAGGALGQFVFLRCGCVIRARQLARSETTLPRRRRPRWLAPRAHQPVRDVRP